MSRHTLIHKEKTNHLKPYPVGVSDYMIFKDLESQETIGVFSIHNKLNTSVQSVSFEVTEYNEAQDTILKSVFTLNDLKIEGQSKMVPNQKFILNEQTVKLKIETILFICGDKTWKQGEWITPDVLEEPVIKSYRIETRKPKPLKFPMSFSLLFVLAYFGVAYLVYWLFN